MAILMSLGGLIICVLAGIALFLWRKVWANQRAIQSLESEKTQKRLDYIHDSINILAVSLLSDQVRVAEASIRLAVLLDNLELSCEQKHLFAPITEVYNRTRHIPTHERFNALKRSERRKFEAELQQIEAELEDRVKEAAKHIKSNPFGSGHAVTERAAS